MKLKSKLIAAAVALVAASGAHAGIANSTTGNGSLVMFAYGADHTTAMFDLGVNMDSFLPAAMSAGGSITWNLGNSSVAGTGGFASFSSLVAADGGLNYGSTFAGFAPATGVKWGVIALDQTGTALGDDRYLSTSNTAISTIRTQGKINLIAFSGVDSFLGGHNLSAGHAVANGASLNTDAGTNSNAVHSTGFGSADKWLAKSTFVATAAAGTAQSFYMLDSRNGTSSTTALVTQYGNAQGNASFLYDDAAGTLTFTQAALVPAIPEPSEYALMLAGLGMVGFMARRRLANKA